MPNHFHFLVCIKTVDEIKGDLIKESSKKAKQLFDGEVELNDFLEDQFRRFFSSFALKYNEKYERRGTVFSEKFKRVSVLSEAKILDMMCYIHHNPIHHKYENDYEGWKYSSYKSFLSKKESFIDCGGFLDQIGGLESFMNLHNNFKSNR